MTITPSDLEALPLFRGIAPAQLSELIGTFTVEKHAAGKTLFQVGEVPSRLQLLAKGEVSLMEGEDERFRLRSLAPIGELGALTSHPRNVTAVAATEVEIHSVPVAKLLAFFESHGPLGLSFYHNLLGLVSDKIHRDDMRVEQMRWNIIRTQKAMKKLRDLVLQSVETEISGPIFEALDELIEHNRRAHYRVRPHPKFPAYVRLDDGSKAELAEVSDGFLKVAPGAAMPKEGEWSAVLLLPAGEMAVSGTIQRVGTDGVVVRMDGFIDEYRKMLEDYMTRLQLLDFVV